MWNCHAHKGLICALPHAKFLLAPSEFNLAHIVFAVVQEARGPKVWHCRAHGACSAHFLTHTAPMLISVFTLAHLQLSKELVDPNYGIVVHTGPDLRIIHPSPAAVLVHGKDLSKIMQSAGMVLGACVAMCACVCACVCLHASRHCVRCSQQAQC